MHMHTRSHTNKYTNGMHTYVSICIYLYVQGCDYKKCEESTAELLFMTCFISKANRWGAHSHSQQWSADSKKQADPVSYEVCPFSKRCTTEDKVNILQVPKHDEMGSSNFFVIST